jgi:hypothetical protein
MIFKLDSAKGKLTFGPQLLCLLNGEWLGQVISRFLSALKFCAALFPTQLQFH